MHSTLQHYTSTSLTDTEPEDSSCRNRSLKEPCWKSLVTQMGGYSIRLYQWWRKSMAWLLNFDTRAGRATWERLPVRQNDLIRYPWIIQLLLWGDNIIYIYELVNSCFMAMKILTSKCKHIYGDIIIYNIYIKLVYMRVQLKQCKQFRFNTTRCLGTYAPLIMPFPFQLV